MWRTLTDQLLKYSNLSNKTLEMVQHSSRFECRVHVLPVEPTVSALERLFPCFNNFEKGALGEYHCLAILKQQYATILHF